MGHFLQITIARKTIQYLVIANCRNGPLSANTIARKTSQFIQKNYTISRDRELQKWVTFCRSRFQEKLYNFSRKTIQFLVIANCRKGPLSANHDRKKNHAVFLENYTVSRDRELQEWATFCKSRSQEKLCSFSRKLYSFS